MIYIASDYAGYHLKESVKKYLTKKGIAFRDVGSTSGTVVNDFTNFVPPVVNKVRRSSRDKGILICGTGYGMAIGANRFKKVRATLAGDVRQARWSRTYDNSNILVLSAWKTKPAQARAIVAAWNATTFQSLDRRVRRFKKIDKWQT